MILRKTQMKALFLPLLGSVVFFVVCLLTIYDYGISWDEPIHFQRGQAYLHYFITGQKHYSNLPVIAENVTRIEGLTPQNANPGKIVVHSNEFRRSYYQHDSLDTQYFLENDSGHPPLNGILAALSNKIFFQDLGILEDVESYHLFNILAASILVFVVGAFAYETFGGWASAISMLVLSAYPLFFSESHFNIKDPPEAAFFGLTIYLFWKSVVHKSWKYLFASSIACGLALGTKFNIVFLPFIVIPFLIYHFRKDATKILRKPISVLRRIPRKYLLVLFSSPIIVAFIFFGTWPYLWQDLLDNTLSIVRYYKDIGTGPGYQPGYFTSFGFNTYPIYWIIVTTPIIVLVLTAIGIYAAFRTKNKYKSAAILWLIWLVFPIARISAPDTTVYGGIRQIMEFIPAMALLAGLGGHYLLKKVKLGTLKYLLISLLFVILALPIVKLHPNENVYFNELIGGLPGAAARNIPSWGNSFGNAYLPAVEWINDNAAKEAKLALVQGTLQNIAYPYLRDDIKFWNGYWSGINREGEYLVELTHQDFVRVYPYAWDYIEKTLEPVFEVKVQGVAIAKVWKNDLEHTKPEFAKPETLMNSLAPKIAYNSFEMRVYDILLTHMTITFDTDECSDSRGTRVDISEDRAQWHELPEPIPSPQINEQLSLSAGKSNYYFPMIETKFIRVRAPSKDSCILKNTKVDIYGLQ